MGIEHIKSMLGIVTKLFKEPQLSDKNHSIGGIISSRSVDFLKLLSRDISSDGNEIDWADPDIFATCTASCYAYHVLHIGSLEVSKNMEPELEKVLMEIESFLANELFDIYKSHDKARNAFGYYTNLVGKWAKETTQSPSQLGPFDRSNIDAAFMWEILTAAGLDIHPLSGILLTGELWEKYGYLPPIHNPAILLVIIERAKRMRSETTREVSNRISRKS